MQKWELSDYQIINGNKSNSFFLLKLQNAEEKDVILENYSMQLSGY